MKNEITEIIELAEEFALRKERLTEDSLVLDIYFFSLNIRLLSEAAKYTNSISEMASDGVELYPSLFPYDGYRKEAVVRFVFPRNISYDDASEWFRRVDQFIMDFSMNLNEREVDSLDEKAIQMLNKEYEYGDPIYPSEVRDLLWDILNRTDG